MVPDGIDVVDLDMEETPEAVISGLHDDGIEVVCYLSAGSWEPYRDDADDFPEELRGEAYIGFEDERRNTTMLRSPASATTAPSRTATASTRCLASTMPPRRISTRSGSTGQNPNRVLRMVGFSRMVG